MNYDPDAMRQRLEKALDDKRLSMRRAGVQAGFSETFVHGIIKLGRDPGVKNLAQLCKSINVPVSYIIFGHDVTPEAEEVLRLLAEKPSKQSAILELLRE